MWPRTSAPRAKSVRNEFVNNDNAQKLEQLITRNLLVVMKLMKLADSDKLPAGNIWDQMISMSTKRS